MTDAAETTPPQVGAETLEQAIAAVTVILIDHLARVRATRGHQAVQVEALAMRAASATILQSEFGLGGMRAILQQDVATVERRAETLAKVRADR